MKYKCTWRNLNWAINDHFVIWYISGLSAPKVKGNSPTCAKYDISKPVKYYKYKSSLLCNFWLFEIIKGCKVNLIIKTFLSKNSWIKSN